MSSGQSFADQLPQHTTYSNPEHNYNGENPPAAYTCRICHTPLASRDGLQVHSHTVHGAAPSEHCGCSACDTWVLLSGEKVRPGQWKQQQEPSNDNFTQHYQEFAGQTITTPLRELHAPSVGLVAAHLQHSATGATRVPQQSLLNGPIDDANISESNLPAYMGAIEAGKFDQAQKRWLIDTRHKPTTILRDHNGNAVVSARTAREMRRLLFLPQSIPKEVKAWLLNYWTRKAAEQGIYMSFDDVADRMPLGVQKNGVIEKQESARQRDNTVSMRVQRYITNLGQLSVVEKRKEGLPAKQAMLTIEPLYIIQGKLNTWWLPTNMTNRGPWIVAEPRTHPAYTERDTSYRGNSYIVEEMYGLSERVTKISDALIFFDCQADEAELPLGALGREIIVSQAKADQPRRDLEEEFGDWCAGGTKPSLTAEHARLALEHATIEKEILAILWGHNGTIEALKAVPAGSVEGVPSLWSQMTDGRVAFLLEIAKDWSDYEQLPFGVIAEKDAEMENGAEGSAEGFALPGVNEYPLDYAMGGAVEHQEQPTAQAWQAAEGSGAEIFGTAGVDYYPQDYDVDGRFGYPEPPTVQAWQSQYDDTGSGAMLRAQLGHGKGGAAGGDFDF